MIDPSSSVVAVTFQLSVKSLNMLKQHRCRLQNPPQDILSQVIETGIFINFRRKYHSFKMISKSHPMTPMYYKFNQSIRDEETRHLINYSHIIHPFSMLALYWEFFIFFVYSISWMELSMISSHGVKDHIYREHIINFYIDVILTIDIMKMFFTGYYNSERSVTVLKPSKIAKKYLKSYFILDVLSTLQSHFALLYTHYPSAGLEQTVLVLRIFLTLRILRLGRWKQSLDLFHMYANLLSFFHRALRATLLYLIMLLWMYAVVFQIIIFMEKYFMEEDQDDDGSDPPRYWFLYAATLLVLRVSVSAVNLDENNYMILAGLALVMGYCLQLFLYTQILKVWIKFSNARNKNESLFQQFTEYLKYKDLPVGLRKKFFSFYQFKFQNQFYNEARINRMVSRILKQEILVYVTKNHVQRVEFFKDMPDTVLAKLVSRLKSEIYLANDIILTAGVAGNCMYFIYFGTVAIYSPGGKEICHLEDGAHFGEIALIFNEPRVATVKAVTPCELFILNRSDFLEVLEPYPDIKDKITLLAQERLRTSGFLKEGVNT